MVPLTAIDWTHYRQLIQSLPFGKVLPNAVYLHRETQPCTTGPISQILDVIASQHSIGSEFNIVKFRTDAPRVSFLSYPDFFEEPHPSLARAASIDLSSG